MKLYLCQHGDAVAKTFNPDRPLSDSGREDIERLANFFKPKALTVSKIMHSGKTRARQTAESLAVAFETGRPTESVSGINPNDDPKVFAASLTQQHTDLLIVSHLPFLAKLASFLLTGEEDRILLAFLPGSIACLERSETDAWTVAWMFRPELFRK